MQQLIIQFTLHYLSIGCKREIEAKKNISNVVVVAYERWSLTRDLI